jgi:endoglycosylceramidase
MTSLSDVVPSGSGLLFSFAMDWIRLLAVAYLPAWLAAFTACSGCSSGSHVAKFRPLDSDGHVLRDGKGRTVILRGYNVKVQGLFDVTPNDGEPPRETIPPLDDADFTLMQKSGVNVLRVPLSWSAFEPTRGSYQASYLAAIDAFVDQVRPYGFFVLLDLHEDGWSKNLCEDGAPAWATLVSAGTPEGDPGADCHTSSMAIDAHSNFFDQDADQLQEAFAAAWQQIAAHFVANETVFGYEIFNEPIGSDDAIDAFSIKIAGAIRSVDPGHLILWQPSSTRNVLNFSRISATPFPVAGGVYDIHISENPSTFARSIAAAREEADSWGQPLFVTEHVADWSHLDWIDDTLNGFDSNLVSSTYWIWAQGPTWKPINPPGVVARDDAGAIQYLDNGGPYEHLTRPYAMAVGGDVDTIAWNGMTLTMHFLDHPGVPSTHDVYWNPGRGQPTVTCDGAALRDVTGNPSTHVFVVTCGGNGGKHTLVFSP